MADNTIGLLGASSLVGGSLIPKLLGKNWKVIAFSRSRISVVHDSIEWRLIDAKTSTLATQSDEIIPYWICLAPIYILPTFFDSLKTHQIKRIVVLSSTSRFTKSFSSNFNEKKNAAQLAASEEKLKDWAEANQIEWIILRPTLIYGFGKDKNISEIARFIARFRFFPLFGAASGLRQPLHAEDVAQACFSALTTPSVSNRSFNLSGGDAISYKEMVIRIFAAFNIRPTLISIPLTWFKLAIAGLRVFPRFRLWSASMAERMNTDLYFDHSDAASALNFSPRSFKLTKQDLPKINSDNY
jgi:nucleoside-diphosphate-sugar epimerase